MVGSNRTKVPKVSIEALAFCEELSDAEKVSRIQAVLSRDQGQRHTAEAQLMQFKQKSQRGSEEADYYNVLASKSVKLQNRVAEIVKELEFQGIEKQLNKGENANKFSRAIAFGNNQDFLYGEKVEQEIAEGCRRLIKNAIICWNYLYLSQKLAQEEDEERRQELLWSIRNSSVVTWHHINLHGEYDFSDDRLRDSVGLDIPNNLELSKH